MINQLGWLGQFKVKTTNKETGNVSEEVVNNRITNNALDKIINILDNIDPNLDIKYLAIGTGTTALNDADTTLVTEIFRTQFVTSNNTSVGEFTTEFAILDSEAIATWGEIGIFCGDSATSSADTGVMLSRILFTKTKTSLEEVTITRIDRVSRA